jgi:hypothetical protein
MVEAQIGQCALFSTGRGDDPIKRSFYERSIQ